MHLSKIYLASVTLVAGIQAAVISGPVTRRSKLAKRATPQLGDGIDVTDPNRGGRFLPREGDPFTGAFSNAKELMYYAVSSKDDAVFAKYFNPENASVVDAIFNRLLGDDARAGAPEMANMIIQAGNPEEPEDEDFPAQLLAFDTEQPLMIISDDLYVYPDIDSPETGCAAIEEAGGMTPDMMIMGSVLVHEYTHWDWFLHGIHGGEIIDQADGRGWEGTRALDKNLAVFNADSYAWFATENLWAEICHVSGGFNDPDAEDWLSGRRTVA